MPALAFQGSVDTLREWFKKRLVDNGFAEIVERDYGFDLVASQAVLDIISQAARRGRAIPLTRIEPGADFVPTTVEGDA